MKLSQNSSSLTHRVIPMPLQMSKYRRARRPAATDDGGDRRPCRSDLRYPFEEVLVLPGGAAAPGWQGRYTSVS
jgi:hypothetical protein